MRYAVVGDQGLFGSEMANYLVAKGETVLRYNRQNIDLEQHFGGLLRHFEGVDVIINAVAYTDVLKAETDTSAARIVNGLYAEKLAQAAADVGSKFFHISTDYVFAGDASEPYPIDAATDPKTEYGRSKAFGERLVSESSSNFTIFRTAWLYGANGRCFPKSIASQLVENGNAKVVNDQYGQPTWTRDLAELLFKYSKLEMTPKIVHAVASGRATWADLACEVAEFLGLAATEAITPVATAQLQTKVVRPQWSVLNNESELVDPIGDWRERWRVAASEVLS